MPDIYNTEITQLSKQNPGTLSMIITTFIVMRVQRTQFNYFYFLYYCIIRIDIYDERIADFLTSNSPSYIASFIYKSKKIEIWVFIKFLTKNIEINSTLYCCMSFITFYFKLQFYIYMFHSPLICKFLDQDSCLIHHCDLTLSSLLVFNKYFIQEWNN